MSPLPTAGCLRHFHFLPPSPPPLGTYLRASPFPVQAPRGISLTRSLPPRHLLTRFPLPLPSPLMPPLLQAAQGARG